MTRKQEKTFEDFFGSEARSQDSRVYVETLNDAIFWAILATI